MVFQRGRTPFSLPLDQPINNVNLDISDNNQVDVMGEFNSSSIPLDDLLNIDNRIREHLPCDVIFDAVRA